MKFAKYLLTAITAIVLISACQKELDFVTDGLAHGSLKSDVTGDCLPSTVNGIFKADSLLDNTNFVDIQVDLTSVGFYDIMSDTVNGYSFRGYGTLGVTGINTVRLYATGKPVTAGTDNFTIKFDNTTCIVHVTVIGAGVGAAVFTLGGSPGTCSGATVNGIYDVGISLDVNNTVTINVNVTAAGTYTIATAAVNGMVFSSVGVFTTLGVQAVTLNGAGIPLAQGLFNLTPANASSSCTFSIDVLGGALATYTLDGSPNACAGATVMGTYTAGIPLTANERVTLNVTVTSAGAYTIKSDTVNGISFIRTSNFPSAGPVTIWLAGSGTPTTSGTFDFVFSGGGNTCTFSITVNAMTNLDYVPETTSSNWSEKLVGGTAADTAYVEVRPNTTTLSGQAYKIFEYKTLGVAFDSTYHRKNGGMYYAYFDKKYVFDNPVNSDGMLLDSNLAVGNNWDIVFNNVTFNSLPVTSAVCLATITAKGATATVAGNNYTNVIKVTYQYSYDLGSGSVSYLSEEIWFAKGIGIIYYKQDNLAGSVKEVQTTRSQIF